MGTKVKAKLYILEKFGLMFPEFGKRMVDYRFIDDSVVEIKIKDFGQLIFIYKSEDNWILNHFVKHLEEDI